MTEGKQEALLAGQYFRGQGGVDADFEKSAFYAEKAWKSGNPRGALILGLLCLEGKEENAAGEAQKWFLKSAQAGDFKAPRHLGLLYEKGEGVKQDYKEAARWYAIAEERGDITGTYLLGRLCELGLGVDKDEKRALELYLKAGNREDAIAAPALLAISELYRRGCGVNPNAEEAEKWRQKYEAARKRHLQ